MLTVGSGQERRVGAREVFIRVGFTFQDLGAFDLWWSAGIGEALLIALAKFSPWDAGKATGGSMLKYEGGGNMDQGKSNDQVSLEVRQRYFTYEGRASNGALSRQVASLRLARSL